ncbi:MAG: AsmA-like C-terminal region-containing protein [Pseudomonadota bacterium]
MVRQTTKVIILETLGVVSLVVMAAIGILAFMLASGPVELGIFRDDVERAMTNARNGRPVTVERLTLQWSPSDRRMFVVADGLSLKDFEGKEAGFARTAQLTLDAGSILLGKIEVLETDLQSGWLNVQNTGPNKWSLAGEPLPEIRTAALPQTPEEWLDRTNTILSDVLAGLEVFNSTFALEELEFSDLDIRVINQDESAIGTISAASGQIANLGTDVSIQLTGDGNGLGLPEVFGVSLDTFDGFQSLKTVLDVGVLPITDLVARFGIEGLEESDLNLGTSFNAEVTRADGLQKFGIVVARQSGKLDLEAIGVALNDVTASVNYLPANDEIEIEFLQIDSARLAGRFQGKITNVLAKNALRRVELQSDLLEPDMSELFEAPWTIKDASLIADLSDDFTIISVDSLEAEIEGARLQASGEFDWNVTHEDGELPFTLDLTAELIGDTSKETVLAYWPVTLGRGARNWLVQNLKAGTVTEVTARVSLKPDSLAEGYLRDEDLDVRFSFKDGVATYLSDMPPIENAVGTGHVGGNSLDVRVVTATHDDWNIQSGTVEFPAFNPRGADFIVTAYGSGPAVSVLRQLSSSRLRLQEQTGFDPERVSGDATATLRLTRPALSNVPLSDMTIDVKGQIKDGGLKAAVGPIDMVEGNVNIDVTLERIILTGFGNLGTSPVQFTWRDAFDQEGLPADLSATAVLTSDVLNVFGLIGRAFLTGEIPVEMQGKVGAGGLQTGTFAFDLSEARLDLTEIDWVKPAGETARATLNYTGDLSEQAAALKFTAETASLDGDLRLSNDGRLESLELRRLFIEDSLDVNGSIARTSTGGFDVRFAGAYLDISAILSEIGAMGGFGTEDGAEGFDLSFVATVDRLRLRRNLELIGSALTVRTSKADGFQQLRASGNTQEGATFITNLNNEGEGRPLALELKTSDAGYLASAFFGVDFIEGGILDLRGSLATEDTPARLRATVEDTRLINAPFFTQVLSLASLRGLTDTLAGDGVLFSRIEAPITIGGGRYVLDGARASGPALGLTVNGWVGIDGKGIDLDGVLVPSFGVNSVLGGVPIIGDLIVGRQGEGIFSITYSVSGSLEKAQVAVNPLSAVTPGILRRIFENPSDTTIPDSLPVDPNLKPPTEKLPDLPDDEFILPTPGRDG